MKFRGFWWVSEEAMIGWAGFSEGHRLYFKVFFWPVYWGLQYMSP